jgi:hypothetical protein
MNIDFRLKTKEQVNRGLIMELIPRAEEGASNRSAAIYIDEEAFGFVEPCIAKCWPAYFEYGHWGSSEIPVSIWANIASGLSILRDSILAAGTSDEVDGLGFIFDEIKVEFDQNFERFRTDVVGFIDNLIVWINEKLSSCVCITIAGV